MISTCARCKCDRATVHYDYGAEKIVRCTGCDLLYLTPCPSPDESRAVYADSYFENPTLLEADNRSIYGYADYIAERFNKQPQFATIARDMRSLLVPRDRPPRLLEVGCGFGYFLNEAFEEGFDVSGVEFNSGAVERLRRKYRFPIQQGPLEEISLEKDHYDVLAMFDVIEHLLDPFRCLEKIRNAMTAGGLLVISTPDAMSPVSRLIGKRLEDFRRTREHLFFFSRDTMTSTLEDHGFDVLSIRSIGHTFELSFLLNRLELYNRTVFSALRWMVERLGLGAVQVRINPLTKMIVVARRRATPRSYPARDRVDEPAEIDSVERRLFEDLSVLEAENSRRQEWVYNTIAPHIGRSVLEVGSGIGTFSKYFLSRCERLHLTDYRPAFLDLLRERFGDLPHVRFDFLDLERPPFQLEDGNPDTIICLNVLEHIEDDVAALRGLAAMLGSSGRLILQVPNYPGLYGSLDESYGHRRRYSPRSLRAALETAGFELTVLRRFDPFAIPGWIAVNNLARARQLNRRALSAYDALVPWLRPFDFLSRVAGLSLIACAEKRAPAPIR
jgi:2-polyprenyl-3-methyl-5-hydroxy-6-metoxy-1,4-benzoquinol methylase